MKGTAKSKVVTSGRLTGGVKVQQARRRVTPAPGPAAGPEPAYSLYSTDSEDQVTSLHKGLDRCAALLSGILQAEKASSPRAVKGGGGGGAAKSRPSTSVGKKPIKKLPTKTGPRSGQSVQRGAGSTTHQPAAPAMKLHPPQKQPPTLLQPHVPPSPSQIMQHLPTTTTTSPPPQPQTSIPPPQPTPPSGQAPLPQTAPDAPHTDREEEEEFVPVRDINTVKTSNMQLEPEQVDKVHQDGQSREDCSAETEERVKTVQYLLGELKALITGQGSVAERLLSHLEQTVSSPLMNVGGSNIQTEVDLSSLHSQNTQLRRRVKILNQQLKEREKAERQPNMETLCNSEVVTLQEELTAAQSRLQELQDELTEVRKALQDTQSQLADREVENALIRTDLETTRSKLLDSEREKSKLASLAQQRLEEIGNLKRILQSQDSSHCLPVVDSSVSDQQQHRPDPAEPTTERITHFLLSLGQLEPTHTEHTEREGHAPEHKTLDTLSHPDVRSQRGRHQNSHLDQSKCLDEVQSCGWRESQCASVLSDWSARSGSTFDTRDEAAFRDGLAALDASIASLQKTIQLDLGR